MPELRYPHQNRLPILDGFRQDSIPTRDNIALRAICKIREDPEKINIGASEDLTDFLKWRGNLRNVTGDDTLQIGNGAAGTVL